VIHQFAELGQFYRQRENVTDDLVQYAADPAAKFKTKELLVLVFGEDGFKKVVVEEYDDDRRLRYLYRAGPPNGWDATPTTGTASLKKGQEDIADAELGNKLTRLGRSVAATLEALWVAAATNTGQATDGGGAIAAWEKKALEVMRDALLPPDFDPSTDRDPRKRIIAEIRERHPDLKERAIVTVAWQRSKTLCSYVGDFEAFRRALVRAGREAASTQKGVETAIKGTGQCCICGKTNTEVLGLLKIQQFKLYTLDKPGSIAGGFDLSSAWQNFPACRECCEKVDFAGERVKKDLTFEYYGFKYILLPSPVRSVPTESYQFLDRLVSARVDRKASKRLTEAEDDLFAVIAQEDNRLQVDLLFYRPDPQSFRPALYVSGLLPTRFRQLFAAQARVDAHPWVQRPSPKPFTEEHFTFGCFREVFPAARGGSTFDDDFLAATRAALELRSFRPERLIEIGMRWVQEDYREGKPWPYRLANLFRSLLFFEVLVRPTQERSGPEMVVDYGTTEQAERVRRLFGHSPATGRLRTDPAAQAAFLVGACCGRIETIQRNVRGSTPFEGKYKGFRLNQNDIQQLFVAAKDKGKAYGPDAEKGVSSLLGCAAAALAATPERWPIGPDEISYFFALGHALRSRLAREQEPEANATPTNED
jgi:CRISPR-associated protein Csh1